MKYTNNSDLIARMESGGAYNVKVMSGGTGFVNDMFLGLVCEII